MAATGIVDRAKLDAAYKGFRTLFDMALKNAPTIASDLLANVVQSNSTEEVYNWMGPLPKMKEWLGDRAHASLRAYDWTVKNKDWANGVIVSANDINDDKLGMVAPRVRSLAEMAARHEEELLINLLIGAATTLCYDGQFFVDTDHVDGDGPAQSNKGTAALDATSFAAAILAMESLVDENSEPLYITPTHLIYGPKLETNVLTLLSNPFLAGGATNQYYKRVEPVKSLRLVGAADDYWFLADLSKAVKPLILQRREPVQFIAQDDPASESYYNRKEYRYGANWRGNAAYGLWQLVYGGIL